MQPVNLKYTDAMAVSMLYFIYAVASPLLYGLMNIADKYVIVHRVKKPMSFALVSGAANLALGIVMMLFADWNGISPKMLLLPAVIGLLFGTQFYLYYFIIKKEDISSLIGLIYTYPLVVAFFSYMLLGERIAPLGYLGVALILLGVIIISCRRAGSKFQAGTWMIVLLILIIASYEMMIKVSTSRMPLLNSISVMYVFIGFSVLPGLMFKAVRQGIIYEIKNNIQWAFITEILGLAGVATVFLAMEGLPATLVSSVGAIQPVAVLLYEALADRMLGRMRQEVLTPFKLSSIALIAFGVALLYACQSY